MEEFSRLVIDRLVARLTGAMSFRFIMQPVFAIALGIRDGLMDARTDTAPFVVDLLFGPATRRALLAGAIRRIAMPIVIGVVLDAVAQHFIFGHVKAVGALIVGATIIGIPYSLARGITNRLVVRFKAPKNAGVLTT
jgi:hypothetical protein